MVVKADGLALGKGVVVCEDAAAALAAIDDAMERRRFGAAGTRVVIEERLTGEEVSFFALCDGENAIALGTGAGSQGRLRRRPRSQHRRDGRVLAGAAFRRRRSRRA